MNKNLSRSGIVTGAKNISSASTSQIAGLLVQGVNISNKNLSSRTSIEGPPTTSKKVVADTLPDVQENIILAVEVTNSNVNCASEEVPDYGKNDTVLKGMIEAVADVKSPMSQQEDPTPAEYLTF
jgi:hypothetical protein